VTRLLIRIDSDTEVVHVINKKVTTIGRTEDNDLTIDTKFISRHHAQMLAGPNFTVLEDLGSTNGVYVNNRRVSKQTLKDSDQVTIGKTRFRFAIKPATQR
jgi:pSer/pThr/pTyr-binding forkhead associated (FHA) protein